MARKSGIYAKKLTREIIEGVNQVMETIEKDLAQAGVQV
jgi:hypothetical protein